MIYPGESFEYLSIYHGHYQHLVIICLHEVGVKKNTSGTLADGKYDDGMANYILEGKP